MSTNSESLLRQSFNYVRHAVERRARPERFIVADKTRHDVIFRDGLMELRYYPMTISHSSWMAKRFSRRSINTAHRFCWCHRWVCFTGFMI